MSSMLSPMNTYRQLKADTNGARRLGWASIGIGLAELAAPQHVQNLLGLEDRNDHRGILRVLGVREVLHGVSILLEGEPSANLTTGLWSRVAGDALDSALLGVAATKTKKPGRFAAVAAAVMGIGLLDVMYSLRLTRDQVKYC